MLFHLLVWSTATVTAENRVLRVGVYNNPPKVFLTETGKPAGIFIDIIEYIAAQEDWTIVYVPGSWKDDLERLENGTIDLMPDVAYSAERAEKFSFTGEPVLSDWFQVYARKGNIIRSIVDLDGKQLAFLENSIQQVLFAKLVSDCRLNVTIVLFPTFQDAMESVARSETDAVVANSFFGTSELQKLSLAPTEVIIHPNKLFFAGAKRLDPEVLFTIDKHLLNLKQEPGSIYYRSIKHWIRGQERFVLPEWLKIAGAVILVLLVLSVVGSVVLSRQVELRTRELKESEERFRALTEHSVDTIMRLDREHRFLYINPIIETMTGIKTEKIIGKTPEELDFPKHLCAMWNIALDKVFVEAKPNRLEFMFPSGIWIDLLLSPELSPAGDVAAVIASARNVTASKKAELEKGKLQEQLVQAQKMEAIGRLAGGVAHDFNNIITGISGYAEMIQASLKNEDPLTSDVREILKAAERAKGLTNQLLAFSRKDAPEPSVIQPNEALANAQKMLRRLIGEDVLITIKPAEKSWSIKIDPGQLDQIIINLAINARDAMPKGGELSIEVYNVTVDEEYCLLYPEVDPGEFVMLVVSDTGCGMDAETIKHIFEPFFTTKAEGRGTGLGLSIVYGIVKQHNGFVTVYSELGMGTTFKVHLPAFNGKTEKSALPTPGKFPTGTETILLVEDESIVRRLAKKLLMKHGYRVIEQNSGPQALAYAENCDERIDLLLTDVVMPGMSGQELHRRLLEKRPHLKALFMSGYTSEIIVHHGVLDEGAQFMQKPFTTESITNRVRQTLDSRIS